MAISITAPQSGYVDRSAGVIVSWTNSDSNLNGKHTSYELQYKLPSETGWNTLGIINSAENSASLNEMFDAAENITYSDAKEYYYRVVLRYENVPSNFQNYTGVEYSDVYSIAFHGNKVGEVKNVNNVYPIYEDVIGTDALNVQLTEAQKGAVPLVDNSSGFAGKSKISVLGYTRSLATSYGGSSFSSRRGNASGYMTVERPFYTNMQYYNSSRNFTKGYNASNGQEYDIEAEDGFLYTKYTHSYYVRTDNPSYIGGTYNQNYISRYNTHYTYDYTSTTYPTYYKGYYYVGVTRVYGGYRAYYWYYEGGSGYSRYFYRYKQYYYYKNYYAKYYGYYTATTNHYRTYYTIDYAYRTENYYNYKYEHKYGYTDGYYISGGYTIPIRSYYNFIGYGYNYYYSYS